MTEYFIPSGVRDSEKLLWLMLCDWCGRNGRCWWSQKKMAETAGWSLRKLRDVMGQLKKAGWVCSVQRGCGRSAFYYVARTAQENFNLAKIDQLLITPEYLRRMPYKKYLLTEHWQKIRELALERAQSRCQLCSSQKFLEVHHNSYKNRGNEQDHMEDVAVLCSRCHGNFHLRRSA